MADVTVERSAELTKEVALLKSRNKTLGNIVDVDKDILIKSKEQATAMGELGDNVKSIGNNILSGAENLTTSIFGGALGGVLNSLTVGMIKRKNENAKNEKEKAKEIEKATAEEKVTREKILESLVDTLKSTDAHKDTSREQLRAMVQASELEKEIAEENEKIKEAKQKALELIGGESSFIGPLLPDGGRSETDTEQLTLLRKISDGSETASEKSTRLENEREAARIQKDGGLTTGDVTKIKLESDESAGGFSFKDIFSKGGRSKLITRLGGTLLGGATTAIGKDSDLAKNLGDKKKWGQLSKGAGFGLITAGLVSIAVGGIQGLAKSKEWGVGDASAALGGALGGIDKGAMGALKNAGKYALLGAGIGSIFPVVGTVIGGAIGALLGAVLGYFGGERIAKGISAMGDFVSKQWNNFLSLFGLDDKDQSADDASKEAQGDIDRLQKNVDRLQKLDDDGVLQEGGKTRLAKMKTQLSSMKGEQSERGVGKSKLTVKERNLEIKELSKSREESEKMFGGYGVAEAEAELDKAKKVHAFNKKRIVKDLNKRLSIGGNTDLIQNEMKRNDDRLLKKQNEVSGMQARLKMLLEEQKQAEVLKKQPGMARGGFIVNQPTYLPSSGRMIGEHGTYTGGGLAYGGIPDGGPEAVIPLSSTRAGAFIDPMARSVAGAVLNQLAMSRVGMSGGAGGSGASVVTGNDMSSNQVSNNTTVINNPSPIGQTLPDEGRDFVSKVA